MFWPIQWELFNHWCAFDSFEYQSLTELTQRMINYTALETETESANHSCMIVHAYTLEVRKFEAHAKQTTNYIRMRLTYFNVGCWMKNVCLSSNVLTSVFPFHGVECRTREMFYRNAVALYCASYGTSTTQTLCCLVTELRAWTQLNSNQLFCSYFHCSWIYRRRFWVRLLWQMQVSQIFTALSRLFRFCFDWSSLRRMRTKIWKRDLNKHIALMYCHECVQLCSPASLNPFYLWIRTPFPCLCVNLKCTLYHYSNVLFTVLIRNTRI